MTISKKRSIEGFTLIEVLIVLLVLGILAAIAIPQFSAHRRKGYNSAALSDLRNVKSMLISYYVEKKHYPQSLN